jgi:hypothetical protein
MFRGRVKFQNRHKFFPKRNFSSLFWRWVWFLCLK